MKRVRKYLKVTLKYFIIIKMNTFYMICNDGFFYSNKSFEIIHAQKNKYSVYVWEMNSILFRL